MSILILLFIGFALITSVFWLAMLADALGIEDPDRRSRWVFTIVFFHFIGALIYFWQRSE